MSKKKIPIWQSQHIPLSSSPQQIIRIDNNYIFTATSEGCLVACRKRGTYDHLRFQIQHVIHFSQQSYILVSVGSNRRYVLHRYEADTKESQEITVDCAIPMKKQKAVFARIPNTEFICLVGGSPISKYELSSNIYLFNIVNRSWYMPKIQENLSDFLNSPKNIFYFSGPFLNIIKDNTFLTYMVSNDVKFIDSCQLKNLPKFKNTPEIAVQSENTYLFDGMTLIRIDMEREVSKINRGIFLNELTEPYILQATQQSLHIYSKQSEGINKLSIKLQDLEQIDANSENIPLLFYFNKQIYSDLVFLIEERQIFCSRQLFEFYSRKFRKIIGDQKEQKNRTNIKLQLKLPTFYFLVQQLYNQFKTQLKYDEQTMLELLFFSNKFQIPQFQKKCQESITIDCDNFQQLYDFYRNVETFNLKSRLWKYFVSGYKELARVLPIGKIEQIIRCLYQPQCQHGNTKEMAFPLRSDILVKSKDKSTEISLFEDLGGFLKNQTLTLELCQKCNKVLNLPNI